MLIRFAFDGQVDSLVVAYISFVKKSSRPPSCTPSESSSLTGPDIHPIKKRKAESTSKTAVETKRTRHGPKKDILSTFAEMSEDSKQQVAQELKNRETMQHERLQFAERMAARRLEQEAETRRAEREVAAQQHNQMMTMFAAQQSMMMNLVKHLIPGSSSGAPPPPLLPPPPPPARQYGSNDDPFDIFGFSTEAGGSGAGNGEGAGAFGGPFAGPSGSGSGTAGGGSTGGMFGGFPSSDGGSGSSIGGNPGL